MACPDATGLTMKTAMVSGRTAARAKLRPVKRRSDAAQEAEHAVRSVHLPDLQRVTCKCGCAMSREVDGAGRSELSSSGGDPRYSQGVENNIPLKAGIWNWEVPLVASRG